MRLAQNVHDTRVIYLPSVKQTATLNSLEEEEYLFGKPITY